MRKSAKKLIVPWILVLLENLAVGKKSNKTMKLVKIKSRKDKIEIEFRSQSFLSKKKYDLWLVV